MCNGLYFNFLVQMYKACVVLFPVELDQAHWAQSCEGGYFAVAAQVMIKNVNYGRDLI